MVVSVGLYVDDLDADVRALTLQLAAVGTGEIARNFTQTAQATQEVTTNIGGVSAAANETGSAPIWC